MSDPDLSLAAIAIGRNEGDRLRACLDSLGGRFDRIVYVDSGSTDGSLEMARSKGAEVVQLDMSKPFTAARARNAGLDHLMQTGTAPQMVQFLDGDCQLQPTWLPTALGFLEDHPQVAVVCGRRRELFPDATLWNRLIDAEWDTPIGQAQACGGDALMRVEALQQVGGYNPTLIAGEEPELCVRLRQAGHLIWRLDAEMTLHDAAMTRFGQWWQRAKRAGHAFAEGAALHGAPPERHYVAERNRGVIWGLVVPVVTVLGVLITPWAGLLLLIWPAQFLRLLRKGYDAQGAGLMIIGKFAESQGLLMYVSKRLRGQHSQLIEYK